LPPTAAEPLDRLLEGLASEPDPPTTVRDPDQAVDLHLADSLTGLEIEGLTRTGAICDLGAGAGFPGLPLAVALPEAQIDLVEATARKAELIERLRRVAAIDNARVIAERAETWAAGGGREAYDAVTARALGPLVVLLEYASPLLTDGGVLVAWKGARDLDEEAQAARAAPELAMEARELRRVTPFPAARERHLHVYAKSGPTPARLPRRPGMARKRPFG
jgi:16S rRNA (guanine527-N7)-methyltransferase